MLPRSFPQTSYIDTLNQATDPVSFVTDQELERELDFFANAQFTFDPVLLTPQAQPHLNNNNEAFQFLWDCNNHEKPVVEEQQQPSSAPPAAEKQEEPPTQQEQQQQPATTAKRRRNQQTTKLSKDEKRRRNTAASARFRIKKKMREQALQRTAYEMTEKSKRLEAHIKELEKEIKWLKALVVEKNEARLAQLIRERPVPVVLVPNEPYTPMPFPSLSAEDGNGGVDDEDDDDEQQQHSFLHAI